MMHVSFYAFYILCFIVQHFGATLKFFCLDFDLVTAAQTQAPNTKDESGCNIVSLCYGGRKWSASLILFHRVVYIKRLFRSSLNIFRGFKYCVLFSITYLRNRV